MLTAEDFEVLDNRYVQKDDCNTRHEGVNKELAEVSVQLAKTNSQLSLLVKICSATLGAAGASIIGVLMKLILK
jgi:hypothetical protein